MLFVFSIICLIVSLLQFHVATRLPIWKLTLVATEYGHWLALVTLVFAVIALLRKPRRIDTLVGAMLLNAATLFFLVPMIQAMREQAEWKHTVETAFPGNSKIGVSLLDFWLGGFSRPTITPKTFVYKKVEATELRMDFYPPQGAPTGNWLMVVHGGGWNSGDRSQLADLNSVIASKGIAVFSVDYRLAPLFHWPAPREDIADAEKYIREHAADFQISPHGRWAILGRSAGGQIAEDAAFTLADAPSGLIAFYAPSDLAFAYLLGAEDDILGSRGLIRSYLNGAPSNPRMQSVYKDASPLGRIPAKAPAVLQFHGPRDSLVWVKHSQRLDKKLKELGIPAAYLELPWAVHGFDYNLHGPGGQISTSAIEYFLEKVFSTPSPAHS